MPKGTRKCLCCNNDTNGDNDLLTSHLFSIRRLIGWLSVALFFFVDLFARLSVDVIEENLMDDFNVDATIASSVFGSSVFFSYAVMQIPHGWLLDNLGPKKAISLSCFVTFLGCVMFSFSKQIGLALVARILTGAGAGCAWLGTIKVTTLNFQHVNGLPETFIGIANAIGLLGGLIAQTPFKLLCNNYGWRQSYFFFSILPLILTFSIYFFVDDEVYLEKDENMLLAVDEEKRISNNNCNNSNTVIITKSNNEENHYVSLLTNENDYENNITNSDDLRVHQQLSNVIIEHTNSSDGKKYKLTFLELLCKRNIYIFGIYLAGCDAPFETIAGLWGATYMHNIQQLTTFESGIAISYLVVVSGFTGLLYGILLEGNTVMRKKIYLCVFAAFISFVGCVTLNICIKLHISLVYVALFCIGQACGGMTGLWCIIPQSILCLHGNLGLVSGIVNTICILVDSLAQSAFGILLDYYWSGTYANDKEKTRYYDEHSFVPAMSFLSFFFLLAALCFYFYIGEEEKKNNYNQIAKQ